jgi:hypothetical protein
MSWVLWHEIIWVVWVRNLLANQWHARHYAGSWHQPAMMSWLMICVLVWAQESCMKHANHDF